ncbi:thioesterase family protein [uncultured Methylobacterium sp.]|uniref:acyl-CoA thioesterase n=1 Tax=uncultured Methylobacterium sp. TaxID=157278 RepID=UPI00259258AE|nr:thioesterase family protein [uncultured Methylobacterium sp.]
MDDERARSRVDAASLRVPFRDVDMHGHVHNAVYLSYCESAINEYLREHDLSRYFAPDEAGIVYLVRKTELVFNRPSRFEDRLSFTLAITKLGSASIAFSVDVVGEGETTPRVAATIVWVCVDAGQRSSTAIPARTREALTPLVAGPASAPGQR